MKRVLAIAMLGIGLIPISGCGHLRQWAHQGKRLGPNHQTPAAEVATDWTEYNSPFLISNVHRVDDECWWEAFGDPEINQIVEAASQNYLPLRAAALRVQELHYQRSIAVGNLFPQQQEAFAEYQRIQFSDNGNQIGIEGLGDSFDLYQAGFNASWEIDLWGRLRRLVESADAELQASIEDEHDIRLTLLADTVAAYVEIRVLQQRLQIAHDQVEAQQETLRIAEARHKGGTATKLDTTQAASVVETTRATIPQLQSSLRLANNRLCLLLGIPTRVLFDEHNLAPIPIAPDSVIVGAPQDLLRRRPDIRRAERQVAAQSALIGVALAELFPTFSLRGTVNWQAFKLPELFESASNAGALIPGVRWNILNYGRLKNNVRVQETRLEKAIIGYRQTVLAANSEVESALTVYLKKKEEITSTRKAVDAVRESLDVATRQYREGNIDLDRVNNLRKDLIQQLDAQTTVEGQSALALIRLFKTMGGGWRLADGALVVETVEMPTAVSVEHQPAEQNAAKDTDEPAAETLPQTLPQTPSQTPPAHSVPSPEDDMQSPSDQADDGEFADNPLYVKPLLMLVAPPIPSPPPEMPPIPLAESGGAPAEPSWGQ